MATRGRLSDRLWCDRAGKTADDIIRLAEQLDKELDDDSLREYVEALRKEVADSRNEADGLAKVLTRSFAATYVASKRATGLTPFRVQVMGGLALNEGCIAEAKTGEGKTLMAAMPAALHALTGRGVHIVTVNSYLTERDAKNIGRIHQLMGISVGHVVEGMSNQARRDAYSKDITYVSNTELGFDYLRDNMALDEANVCQRGLTYAIVDEADSILIDEARTPLLIAGNGRDMSALYKRVDKVVSSLREGTESRKFNKAEAYAGVERTETGDYIVHEKDNNVILTDEGVRKVEQGLGIDNYSAAENRPFQHAVEQSLRAHALMHRDKDYIIRKGAILIVDEFTGRAMDGRRYSDGLHQAIEAKEHLRVSAVNETVAQTTYQNFFRHYELLSGMTGTAMTERRELKSTYGLTVRAIPTNRPMIRVDEPDHLFLRKGDKHRAIADRVADAVSHGRPVLVGTPTVESSEEISAALRARGIKHTVLNAKQDAKEAAIVAKAGVSGTVTVATNMAGRGTDIILDDRAREAGGLLVIGTEKNEAKRIDDQLRGRAGRQGDAGTSVFYCSTEDRVMRLYGSDKFHALLAGSDYDKGEEIGIPSILKAIGSTQRKVEANNFAARRDTLDYDDVNDVQRERIYAERRRILAKEDLSEQAYIALHKAVGILVRRDGVDGACKAITARTGVVVPVPTAAKPSDATDAIYGTLAAKLEDMGFADDDMRQRWIRRCLLVAIDSAWSEQLKALEFAKEAVSYVGYGQVDPKAAYAHEAYELYERMLDNVYLATLSLTFSDRGDEEGKMEDAGGKQIRLKSGRNMVV